MQLMEAAKWVCRSAFGFSDEAHGVIFTWATNKNNSTKTNEIHHAMAGRIPFVDACLMLVVPGICLRLLWLDNLKVMVVCGLATCVSLLMGVYTVCVLMS
nr:hypothetical protein [Tanacetum cinerariifolium]